MIQIKSEKLNNNIKVFIHSTSFYLSLKYNDSHKNSHNNIFNYDLVLVPVKKYNDDWSLITIDIKKDRITHLDSQSRNNDLNYYDCFKYIKDYLVDQFFLIHKRNLDFTDWKINNEKSIPIKGESNINSSVYILFYAKHLILNNCHDNIEPNYKCIRSKDDINYLRNDLFNDVLNFISSNYGNNNIKHF
jgi:hypothetical protein